MKYIKLFENFNQNDLEDIHWILVDLDDTPKLISNELNGNLLVYSVPGDYSKETNVWTAEFKTAKLRLDDEGYTLLTDENDAYISDRILIIKTDYLEKYSLDEIALQYLEQFKNLKEDESVSWPLFKSGDKTIFMVHEGIKTAVISKDVWYLLDMIFPPDKVDLVSSLGVNRKVEGILLKWIKENYHFDKIEKVHPN
jgi:hypothetical protein